MIGQLRDDQLDVWLRPEDYDRTELMACLEAPPDDELVAYPLREDVGGVRYDDAEALEAVGPAVTWAEIHPQD